MAADDLDLSMLMKGNGADGGGAMFGDFGEMSDDPEGQLVVEKGGGGGTNDLETGVIVDNESVVELVVSTRDKDREDKERDKKIAKLDLELRAFQRKLKGIAPDKQVDKDKIKIKMMEITDKMQDLRDEKMDD